jgi:hypothetical protein
MLRRRLRTASERTRLVDWRARAVRIAAGKKVAFRVAKELKAAA